MLHCIPLSVFRTVERSNFKPIVHISALTKSESGNIHLVAITKTGLFFLVHILRLICYF